ncbi:MAG TPA: hypothetical protein VKE74_17305 [Gemmataceae bacterium]|nr:hypothetical protein [Gemmataceae bacterium]
MRVPHPHRRLGLDRVGLVLGPALMLAWFALAERCGPVGRWRTGRPGRRKSLGTRTTAPGAGSTGV